MEVRAASLQTLSSLGDDVLRGANRSLELLRQIEDTIDSLCYDQQYFRPFPTIAKRAMESVRNSPRKRPLDPNGDVEKKLLESQGAIRNLYNHLIEKRKLAIGDPRLTEDDGLADEYARTIQVVTDVHNALNSLRLTVSEHDADVAEKLGSELPTYPARDIEKLIADLKA